MTVRRAGTLTEGDLSDWANYARQVVPLAGRRKPEPRETAASDTTPAAAPEQRPAARLHRRRPVSPPPLRIGDPPPGVDKATWNRFRTGRLPPARRLDLHGHTVHRAYEALSAALHSAHADRLRCIEVVTGRGSGAAGGAIRRELPIWLNLPELRPLVLAAAHPDPDNPGATRVLLRRSR